MASPRRLKGDIKLDDPGALRALAHPARLAVVDELYQGVERTSSELGELTGLSAERDELPPARARALGRSSSGATPREDGRERPWRAAGRTLSLDPETVSAAAVDVVAATTLPAPPGRVPPLGGGRAAASRRRGATSPASSRAYLWLTEDEAAELDADLRAVLKKHTADRDAAHHPEGTRRVFCLIAIVPEA